MIKIYNNSKLLNNAFLPIFKYVYKQLNLKGKLVTVITNGRRGGGCFYNSPNLHSKRFFKSNRFIVADLGFVVINPLLKGDPLHWAEHVYNVILHEFKHSCDYYLKLPFDRSLPYLSRSHEIRARHFVYEVQKDENLLLNLAIEIERVQKLIYK